MCATKSETRCGCLDHMKAETMVALMGAQLCVRMGFTWIQMEGDAQVVVDEVNSLEPNDSCRGLLFDDIRSVLRGIPCWKMNFSRREVNNVAHALAYLATSSTMNKLLISAIKCLFTLLYLCLLGF
jgi:hypothetical protein